MYRPRQQQGLSLLWTAFWSAMLAILIIGGLYSMRYGRNPFFDAVDSLVGKAANNPSLQKSDAALEQAKSAVSGKPVPVKPDGTVRKCVINGKVTYSDVECHQQGEKLEIKQSQGVELVKPPPKEEPQPTKTMRDLAVERATR